MSGIARFVGEDTASGRKTRGPVEEQRKSTGLLFGLRVPEAEPSGRINLIIREEFKSLVKHK